MHIEGTLILGHSLGTQEIRPNLMVDRRVGEMPSMASPHLSLLAGLAKWLENLQ
jgi:hypothetical protein